LGYRHRTYRQRSSRSAHRAKRYARRPRLAHLRPCRVLTRSRHQYLPCPTAQGRPRPRPRQRPRPSPRVHPPPLPSWTCPRSRARSMRSRRHSWICFPSNTTATSMTNHLAPPDLPPQLRPQTTRCCRRTDRLCTWPCRGRTRSIVASRGSTQPTRSTRHRWRRPRSRQRTTRPGACQPAHRRRRRHGARRPGSPGWYGGASAIPSAILGSPAAAGSSSSGSWPPAGWRPGSLGPRACSGSSSCGLKASAVALRPWQMPHARARVANRTPSTRSRYHVPAVPNCHSGYLIPSLVLNLVFVL
jgi:hypothetical protein